MSKNEIHTQFEGKPYAFRMIPIEGNIDKEPFDMGDDNSEYDDEKPKHKVTLSDFYISEHLVTQDLWAYIMRGTDKAAPSRFKGGNRPAEQVSWDDIVDDFLPKLNKATEGVRKGMTYRLPTEAEWEYAARGGQYWAKYPFEYAGSDKLEEVAWYDKNSYNETQNVGLKMPNLLGLYDMSGNVWEWCQDWDDSEFYKKSAALQPNPCNTVKSSYRVLRGGSYFNDARHCRPAYRSDGTPAYRYNFSGFRLVFSSLQFTG